MVKTLSLILFAISFSSAVFAQTHHHSIGIEFGGAGLIYNVNYEYQSNRGVLARIGLGYTPGNNIFVPIQVGKIFGNRTHHLEVGLGITYWLNWYPWPVETDYSNTLLATSFFGYRYQKLNCRFFFRGGFAPFWEIYANDPTHGGGIYPYFGIGGGYRFGN